MVAEVINLLAIVGPTASGKTALAIELAKKMNGEIICADSRTVYKYLDIGTAKPTKEEQTQVPHHLIDVVEPDQDFNVADFKHLADQAIADIRANGKLPIIVGGSGLYIDSVLYDYSFTDSTERDTDNPRHSAVTALKSRKPLAQGNLIIGLNPGREVVRQRIADRVSQMLNDGFVDEVRSLLPKYSDTKAFLAPGYKAFADYIDNKTSIEDASLIFVNNDRKLAKRQMTWFKRNPDIYWFKDADSALAFVAN